MTIHVCTSVSTDLTGAERSNKKPLPGVLTHPIAHRITHSIVHYITRVYLIAILLSRV